MEGGTHRSIDTSGDDSHVQFGTDTLHRTALGDTTTSEFVVNLGTVGQVGDEDAGEGFVVVHVFSLHLPTDIWVVIWGNISVCGQEYMGQNGHACRVRNVPFGSTSNHGH